MSGAILIAKKSVVVTRAQLAGIPAPESTPTWRPISHAELMELMQDRLEAAGYRIKREQYAVQRQGLRLFGTLDLVGGSVMPSEGASIALGFRHGNDKALAISMVGGQRVTICDNLALAGDEKIFRNKHQHGVFSRMREAMGKFFAGLGQQIELVKDRFGVWSAASLTDDEAKVLLYDAIAKGIIPSRLRPEIHDNYFRAEALGYEDSAPRTKMGLSNAFTRAFKALAPVPAYEANLGLTKLMGVS